MTPGSARATAVGLAAGIVVSAVELYAVGGHLPPVVIVALQIVVAAALGVVWGWTAWPGTLAAALPLPAVHALRHALGWPDTISPNTWDAITMMTLFALAVGGAGLAAGAIARAAFADDTR